MTRSLQPYATFVISMRIFCVDDWRTIAQDVTGLKSHLLKPGEITARQIIPASRGLFPKIGFLHPFE